jgi:hypothetical protein
MIISIFYHFHLGIWLSNISACFVIKFKISLKIRILNGYALNLASSGVEHDYETY